MVEIRKVAGGDEESLAFIQTESWKAAFKNILSAETLAKCTDISKATAMYRKLLEENVRAIEFYKKFGFVASGKKQAAFDAVEEMYIKEINKMPFWN